MVEKLQSLAEGLNSEQDDPINSEKYAYSKRRKNGWNYGLGAKQTLGNPQTWLMTMT